MGFQAEAQKIMALRAIAKENVRASVLKNGRMDAFEKNRVSEERKENRTERLTRCLYFAMYVCGVLYVLNVLHVLYVFYVLNVLYVCSRAVLAAMSYASSFCPRYFNIASHVYAVMSHLFFLFL